MSPNHLCASTKSLLTTDHPHTHKSDPSHQRWQPVTSPSTNQTKHHCTLHFWGANDLQNSLELKPRRLNFQRSRRTLYSRTSNPLLGSLDQKDPVSVATSNASSRLSVCQDKSPGPHSPQWLIGTMPDGSWDQISVNEPSTTC